MLILTRRANEALTIGDKITITVLGVKGGQVRLGIDAPRDVNIQREEIRRRLKRNQASTPSDGAADKPE